MDPVHLQMVLVNGDAGDDSDDGDTGGVVDGGDGGVGSKNGGGVQTCGLGCGSGGRVLHSILAKSQSPHSPGLLR